MVSYRSGKRVVLFTLAFAVALASSSCSKKKKSKGDGAVATQTSNTSDPTDTTDGAIEASEDTVVTIETGRLQLASMVTILPAKEGTSLRLQDGERELAFALAGDQTLRLRVNNEAFEALDQAGEIMCFLSQTKFWEQANEGVYKAQVDESQCARKSDKGGGGGQQQQQSSQQNEGAQQLTLAFVEAKRAEGKPLIGEFRLTATGDEGSSEEAGFYHVKVIIVAPPDENNPAGIFDMRFTQHGANGETGQYGFIRTKRSSDSKFILEIGMAGSEGGGREFGMQGAAELERVDNDNFIGYVRSSKSGSSPEGSESGDYKARFDDSFLNVEGLSQYEHGSNKGEQRMDGCYDRNKYKTAIYRYDLLDASGNPVKLNAGFPAEFEKNGQVYQAHASHWGLWVNGGASPETGDTIYKVEWGNNGGKSRTPYTVFAAPGKLMKLTKATVTLKDLKGVDFNYWQNNESYMVRWDGSKLAITARVSYGERGMEEEAASGDIEIPEWGLNLWVSSLNANIQIPYGLALSDDTTLAYHSETTVSGTSDIPAGDLVCFQNCPIMNPAAGDFERGDGGNGPMFSALYKTSTVTWGDQSYTSNQAQDIASPLATYSFASATQTLSENGVAFELPAGLPSEGEQAQQLMNVWSGALIPQSAWQALSDKSIDPYRAQQELDVYYRWSAGAQNWHKFQSLKDADDNFVSFDRPLDLSYVLSSADEFDGLSDSSIVGKSYRLNYNGPGELHGIPWKYNQSVGHEMPLFSLRAGTQIGDYTVQPLEGEQRMEQTDAANCSSLSLDVLPNLPVVDKILIDVGALGDDESPVRYIGGVEVGS